MACAVKGHAGLTRQSFHARNVTRTSRVISSTRAGESARHVVLSFSVSTSKLIVSESGSGAGRTADGIGPNTAQSAGLTRLRELRVLRMPASGIGGIEIEHEPRTRHGSRPIHVRQSLIRKRVKHLSGRAVAIQSVTSSACSTASPGNVRIAASRRQLILSMSSRSVRVDVTPSAICCQPVGAAIVRSTAARSCSGGGAAGG